MRTRIPLIALALTVSLFALAGCGGSSRTSGSTKAHSTASAPEVNPAGDIPDTQVYVPYTSQNAGYIVTVPEGWARTDAPDGAMFTDNFNSVRVEKAAAATPPTVASVETDIASRLRADGGTTAISRATVVARKSGNAILITYVQESAPNSTTGKRARLSVERYAFWKNGTLVTLTLSGAQGADNVDPWRTVTDSFAWSP